MRKSSKDLFKEVKIKMVMKVYGVSCGEAKKLIAKRGADVPCKCIGDNGDALPAKAGSIAPDEEEEFMSAEEFFGSC